MGSVPQRIRASPSYARRIAARAIASSLARCSGGDGHRVDQRKGRSDGRGQPRAGSSQAVKETKQGGCCSSGSVFTEQVGTESVGKKTRKQLPTISGAAILWLETLDQTNKHATITNTPAPHLFGLHTGPPAYYSTKPGPLVLESTSPPPQRSESCWRFEWPA